jgi:hypothetical protein
MSIDRRETFRLPAAVDLEPGTHVMRFAGDRYVPIERKVAVVLGKMTDLGHVRLRVGQGVATFELVTSGATLVLVGPSGDRREIPTTPLSVSFPGNETWVIHATKAGFCEYTRPIDFSDGVVRKTFRIELQPGC